MENLLKVIKIESLQLNSLLYCLLAFIGLDILSGLMKAIVEKRLNSSIMKKGLYGKVGELIVVFLTLVLGYFLNIGQHLASLTCLFYIAQEGLSILENTGSYISYPAQIKDILEKLKSYTKESK